MTPSLTPDEELSPEDIVDGYASNELRWANLKGEAGIEFYKESFNEAFAAVEKYAKECVATIEKAYGGCHNCYGKGYATYDGTYFARRFKWKDPNSLVFCDCERGKQLETAIATIRQEAEREARIDELKNNLPDSGLASFRQVVLRRLAAFSQPTTKEAA